MYCPATYLLPLPCPATHIPLLPIHPPYHIILVVWAHGRHTKVKEVLAEGLGEAVEGKGCGNVREEAPLLRREKQRRRVKSEWRE